MLISTNVYIKSLSVHRFLEEGLMYSESPLRMDDEFTTNILIHYFFSSFKDDFRQSFSLENSTNEKAVSFLVKEIFDNPESLHSNSRVIAKRLFDVSSNSNIKRGDFFSFYAQDCVLDDEIVEVIGIFKAENKDTYLKLNVNENLFGLEAEEGINIIDKGALIFNTDESDGYVILTIDKTNREEAQYWTKEFLGLEPKQTEYFQTQQLVNFCQDFITHSHDDDQALEKISLMNDSMKYLNSNESFDSDTYKKEILQEDSLIQSYDDFLSSQPELSANLTSEEIPLSHKAVKQTKKYIRSVIKLDKNFHVYVHGNRENIDKGFDANKQKSFYKLYFENES